MDRIRAATLALALSVVLTAPAAACRDAQDGKPWRPKEAAPGAVVQTIDVATGTRVFRIGVAKADRVHFCVRMGLADATDQRANMSLYLWGSSNENFYAMSVVGGRLSVFHRLSGKDYELVPPTDFPAAKKGGDRMVEFDVKANRDGADVEIDGEPVANIIARPPAGAKWYGLLFTPFPGKPSSFRLGHVLTFGDESQAP